MKKGNRRMIAALFIILTLPTTLIQVYLTPPIQVADEENHFLRALQISDGHIFGKVLADGNAGGNLDKAAPVFAHDFDALKFHPDTKVDHDGYATAAALQWGEGREPAAFPNTAIYPFFLYLPASLGLHLGRLLHMSVLDTFYLGRLATALTSVGLATLALAVCGRGRILMFVILCFPMTLSLFASVSQDAMAIALGALGVSLWSGYVTQDTAMPLKIRAVMALALGAVAAARIPLIPLCVLAYMPTTSSIDGHRRSRALDWATASICFVPLAIGVYGAKVAKVAFREGDGVSPSEQLKWVALHPFGAVAVAVHTLGQDTARHAREMVGVLGWLDTDLPESFYFWVLACVLVALMVDLLSSGRAIGRGWRLVPVVAVMVTVAGVFAAFYLAWTPVGAEIVDGVQGRYFLVPGMVLAVSLPMFSQDTIRSSRTLDVAGLALCGAVALADAWIVPITLLHRYYG